LATRAKRTGWTPCHWVTLRRIVQYLALLIFVVLFVGARKEGWPAQVANLAMRLDPLAVLAHLLASRTFLAGSALALIVVVLTLGFGRAWCGWLCPLGTLLDVFSLRHWRGKRQSPPDAWRGAKYGLLLTLLIAAILTNLTLMVLDPLTILFRTLSVSVWPALDQIFTAAEAALYFIPILQAPLSSFDALVRPHVLPYDPTFYRYTLLYAGIFIGIVLLNLAAERFWCRYLCPLGALLGVLSKVAIVRREVGDECKQCTLCTRACPTGTIQPAKGYASDPGECTMCLECWPVCPQSGVRFSAHLSAAQWNHYDPSRRQALATLGVAVAGIGLFRSDLVARRDQAYAIRPPGARENNLLSKCIRCAECSRACPTGAIQPALTEAGLEGLWTPVLVPRLGYCDYSCNACGQLCPVQAIPPLSLDDKRQQVIGQAYIDQNRCIVWADYRNCLVCEEMCPVSDKAIKLEEVEVRNGDGEMVTVKQPRVIRERCIGCGICEFKCPVNGEAAIRVYVPGNATPL
jgi:polyferredoxin